MNFEMTVQDVRDAISVVQGSISKLTDVSSHFIFVFDEKGAYLQAYNDLTLCQTPLKVETSGNFVFSIPSKNFKKWLAVLSSTEKILFQAEKGKVSCSVSKGKVSFPSETIEVERLNKKEVLEFDLKDFFSAFLEAKDFASKDQDEKDLAQVFFQDNTFYATDKVTAFMVELGQKVTTPLAFGIHLAEFSAFTSFLEAVKKESAILGITSQEHHIEFYVNDHVLRVRKVFPNCRATVLKNEPTLQTESDSYTIFDKEELKYGLRFLSPTSSDATTVKVIPLLEASLQLEMSSDVEKAVEIKIPIIKTTYQGDPYLLLVEHLEKYFPYVENNFRVDISIKQIHGRFTSGVYALKGESEGRHWKGLLVWKVEI